MRYLRGFDEQLLAVLERKNPETHVEAVWAAGAWPVEAAWQHVVDLGGAGDTERTLLIANDSWTRKPCIRAGERHLVVPAASESAFRRGLRNVGAPGQQAAEA